MAAKRTKAKAKKRTVNPPKKSKKLGQPPPVATWSIRWTNALGQEINLPGPTTSKILRGDAAGPFWSNT